MVSLPVPRRCLRRLTARRSAPTASYTRCLHTSRTDSRPRAACSACYLLVWRAPQVSFNYLFKSCRCALPPDVTNVSVRAEIDFIYISAGRRIVSAIRWSAESPRSPPALYPFPRTLPIPHIQEASCEAGGSGSGGGAGELA